MWPGQCREVGYLLCPLHSASAPGWASSGVTPEDTARHQLQAEELKEEEEVEELTSETTDGHCARLVVSVHSLKLREEGTELVWLAGPAHPLPGPCYQAPPAGPSLAHPPQAHSPAGFPAYGLAAQLFVDKGLVQFIVAVH